MDLDGIRLLLQVVELGSVHRAALQLRTSRSLLRRRLHDLETEVGCRLLIPTASGVTLTAAGSIVVKEGRELLDCSARMVASAQATTSQPDGVLRVIVPPGMPMVPRTMMMRLLQMSSPGLKVHEFESPDPLGHLQEPFDLMFHHGPPPSKGEWFSRVLNTIHLVPVATQAYLDTHGCPRSLEELAQHPLLSWQRPGRNPLVWGSKGGEITVDPYTVSNNPMLLHMAAQEGVGILLGTDDPVFQTGSTPLVRLLDDIIGEDEVLRVLSPSPINADPRRKAAVEAIRVILSSHQS